MFKKLNQKIAQQNEQSDIKRNPNCPDCPTQINSVPVKEGDRHISMKNFQWYIFKDGQWQLDILDTATKSDAFSSSNPWWQANNKNPYISEEEDNWIKESQHKLDQKAKEAKERERQWKTISNVLNKVEPIGIKSDSEEYCEYYDRYETIVLDSVTSFKNPRPNCFSAAAYQLDRAGYDQTGPSEAYQLYIDDELNKNLDLSIEDGIKYVKSELEKGVPIMAGLSHGESTSDALAENHNKKTQHYVIIVGMGYDKKKDMNYFSYYDNGFNPKGDLEVNRFYFNEKDKVFRRNKSLKIPDVLTEFRISVPKKKED